VIFEGHFGELTGTVVILCAQLTRNLLAIATFLVQWGVGCRWGWGGSEARKAESGCGVLGERAETLSPPASSVVT